MHIYSKSQIFVILDCPFCGVGEVIPMRTGREYHLNVDQFRVNHLKCVVKRRRVLVKKANEIVNDALERMREK